MSFIAKGRAEMKRRFCPSFQYLLRKERKLGAEKGLKEKIQNDPVFSRSIPVRLGKAGRNGEGFEGFLVQFSLIFLFFFFLNKNIIKFVLAEK